jgi:ribonuclease D
VSKSLIVDVGKLLHRDITVTNFVDCAVKAKEYLLIPQNRVAGVASLAGLTAHLLRRSLPKDPRVRLSNWDNPNLSESQIKYAILDSYAGAALYKFVIEHQNGYNSIILKL